MKSKSRGRIIPVTFWCRLLGHDWTPLTWHEQDSLGNHCRRCGVCSRVEGNTGQP